MKAKTLSFLLSVVFFVPLLHSVQLSTPIAFLHVNVIPMDQERILQDVIVLVRNGKIEAIGKNVSVPQSAIRVEGAGKYLIPGLVDAHAHVNVKEDLLLYLAYGVTTIQGLGGNEPSAAIDWNKQMAVGDLKGPNYINCDSVAENFANPEAARSFVREMAKNSYPCLKVYSPPDWTAETYRALLDEAAQRNVRTVGHLPRNLDIDVALDTRLQTIAHAEEYLYTFFNKKENKRNVADIPWIVKLTKDHGIAVIANFTAYHKIGIQTSDRISELMAMPELQYLPESVRESWAPPLNRYRKNFDADASKRLFVNYEFLQKFVLEMKKQQVPLIAGTDSSRYMPFVLPGLSMFDELEEFVTAGFNPYESLYTATVAAAKSMRASDQFGQIRKGMRADLVLLDADPLYDIKNVRRQSGVVVRGEWFPKSDIQKLLEQHVRKVQVYDSLLRKTLTAKTDEDFKNVAGLIHKSNAGFGESAINGLGYEYLFARKNPTGAIALFRLNTELYPNSWNAYDSLAEAYMAQGNNQLAIQFYKKSVQLNPNNSKGSEMLKKLEIN